MPGERKPVPVIKGADGAVEPGKTLLQNLLKGIGNAELAVYDDGVAAALPHAQGLYEPAVAAGRPRAGGVLVLGSILGGGLLGKTPIGGLGPGLNQAVRLLPEKHQNGDYNSQKRPGQEKGGDGPAGGAGKPYVYAA